MVNQELIDYVKNNLSQGYTHEQITEALRNGGHSEEDISAAVSASQFQQEGGVEHRSFSHLSILLALGFIIIVLTIVGFLVFTTGVLNVPEEGLLQKELQSQESPEPLIGEELMEETIRCRIATDALSYTIPLGETLDIQALNFTRNPDDIIWESEDLLIVTPTPNRGEITTLTAVSQGTIRMTVIDSAVGEQCTYRFSVQVE
jgi:hypothetical protein